MNKVEGVVRSFYSTGISTPELILKNGKRGLLVYEYIDHLDNQISGHAENIRILQALKGFAFTGGADFIVASARKLEAEAVEAAGRDKVILVPIPFEDKLLDQVQAEIISCYRTEKPKLRNITCGFIRGKRGYIGCPFSIGFANSFP